MSTELARAAEAIRNSHYALALTGAGISKESNVPTFRGADGLWKKHNVMDLATPQAFSQDPEVVWEWYSWRQGLISSCEPNPAHGTLAKWEKDGILRALVTQNVDGLHRRAGSINVLEVHGNLWATRCTRCSYRGRLTEPAVGAPHCPECGEFLRPDVVWFGESLDSSTMSSVYDYLERTDVCIIIGTSGIVQPAASFPLIVKQNSGCLIEVNVETSALTRAVDFHLSGKAGEVLPSLDEAISSF